jgi:hypothetical protein
MMIIELHLKDRWKSEGEQKWENYIFSSSLIETSTGNIENG